MFADRVDAGRGLAEILAPRLAGQHARIYGLARGGVIVGRAIADRLALPLQVLIACKVGAPGQPELAVGAVAEGGGRVWDAHMLRELALDTDWCARAAQASSIEVERRRCLYRDHSLMPDPRELAVVVDDGIATGNTVLAAIRGLAAMGAERRVVATPVASGESLERLGPEVEWVAAAYVPDCFGAVGAHYVRFDPVPDDELLRALAAGAHR